MIIDATRKWEYPPVALPARVLMDKARNIWEKEGLPKLPHYEPYYGYEIDNNWIEDSDNKPRMQQTADQD